MTNSEQSSQGERDYYESVFKCKVIDEFSSEELQSIAYQCSSHSYHEVSDCTYIELLKEDSDTPVESGNIGEITGTCLINRVMPLIRYRQGDYAVKISEVCCTCGKSTPIIGKPIGRINSSFILEGGRIIPSGRILDWSYSLVLLHHLQITQFKITQNDLKSVSILVVGDSLSDFDLEFIEKSFRSEFNEEFQVTVSKVKHIPKESNGKFMPIVSNVSK